jgi:hypothetical protein
MTKKLCFKRSWLLRTLSFTYVWVKFNFVSTVKTVSFKVRWDKDQSPKEKWPREHAQPFKQFGKGQIWQKKKLLFFISSWFELLRGFEMKLDMGRQKYQVLYVREERQILIFAVLSIFVIICVPKRCRQKV